jgi:hypothetical protein
LNFYCSRLHCKFIIVLIYLKYFQLIWSHTILILLYTRMLYIKRTNAAPPPRVK